MKALVSCLLALFTFGLSAQNLRSDPYLTVNSPSSMLCYNDHPTPFSHEAAKVDLRLNNQKKTGTALLITAGCMTVVGVASYLSAWTMIDYEYAGVFSIGGIALAGASIPLYIAGSVLYVKGSKRSGLALTQNGLTFKF